MFTSEDGELSHVVNLDVGKDGSLLWDNTLVSSW
jgi:hypothetical protein